MSWRGLVGWLLLPALFACGADEPPPPDSPGIALSDLCLELAKVDCERLMRCGSLSAPFDLELCQERQAQIGCAPVAAGIGASVEAGSLSYFELAARDCRSAVGALDCAIGLEHDILAVPACKAMIEPKGGADAACPIALACNTGFYCAVSNGCPGACQAYAGVNESCASTLCAANSYCSVTGMRCLAASDLNQPCGISLRGNSCLPGGYCDMSNPAAPACRPVRGRGQGCGNDYECAVGARCIQSRCAEGEANDSCLDDNDCKPGLACSNGRCAVRGVLDASCMANGPPCAEGLSCTSSVGMTSCIPRALSGESCSNDHPCYLASCVAGRCSTLAEDGQPCTAAGDCLPGRSCSDQRCAVQAIDCR